MLEFEVNGKLGNVIITLPTNLEEISKDFLLSVTNDVIVGDNYSLIGICYREKVSTIIMSAKQNKNLTTSVVPIFIKCGALDDTSYVISKLEVRDKLIVDASNIATGHHVICPKNPLTINKFINYVEGDRTAFDKAIKLTNQYVYFLEFKIIPNCDIIGIYKDIKEELKDNPFKVRNNIVGLS